MTSTIDQIKADLNTFTKNAGNELRGVVQAQNETRETIDRMQAEMKGLYERLPAGGYRPSIGASFGKQIATKLLEGKGDFDRSARLRVEVESASFFERKATLLTTGGSPASDLYAAQNAATIGTYGGFAYGGVRRLFREVGIDGGAVFQVRESSNAGWSAGMQIEGQEKQESVAELTGVQIPVQTVATFINLSKQALDDINGLSAFLDGRLIWALEAELESQLLTGSGAGTNLTGLSGVAQLFDYSWLDYSAGWNVYDVIGASAAQLRLSGFTPSFVVMNPVDAFKMRHAKDDEGRYLAAPGQLPPVIESAAMTEGSFVTGDSSQAVIRPRMAMTIDLSEEHGTNFTSNLLTIRAEMRLAFQILSTRGFVFGSTGTSPAAV